MKQRIEEKIEAIIDRIINKPTEEITLDDYTILTAELRDIRFRESQAENGKRMLDAMASAFPAFTGGLGPSK